MWYRFTVIGLLALVSSTGALGEKLTSVMSAHLFVPTGFDDNDEIVAVLDGYLPDTCYKLAPAEVKVDTAANTIAIQQMAREFGGPCFDVTVPYTSVVRLGQLAAGEFRVVTNFGQVSEKLEVQRATKPGPDDYLYAPIDTVRVVGHAAILQGRFTSSCLSLAETKVIRTGNTVVILPIMKVNQSRDGGTCTPVEKPFVETTSLPDLEPGRYLLHVRSLNGEAVNVVFTQPKL